MSNNIELIFADQISEPEHAMRSELNRDGLFELAADIKKNGLINPITVRPKGKGYEVVAGHRRFKACGINNMVRIPCVVRDLTDKQVFEIMTAENLERSDVDPVDEADHIARHMEMTGETPAEVAKSIRRSLAYVESRLAVGRMPEYMKAYLKAGDIKLGVALALTQIENERIRERWTHLAVEQGTSVAQAEFQLHDYRTNKQMYDGIISEATETADLPPPKAVLFRCAIDGQEYDARLCKTIIVAEANMQLFNEIVSELRSTPAEMELTPGE